MVKKEQIDLCAAIARKYGVSKLILFGSGANDPSRARDLDFICSGLDGLDLLRMAAEMENETGVSVDAVPGEPFTPFVEANINRGRVIYGVA